MTQNCIGVDVAKDRIDVFDPATGFDQIAMDRAPLARFARKAARQDALVVFEASCLIPRFDGAILSLEWKEAVWDKFVMAAPRPRTRSELTYSDRKLRSRS